MLLIFIALGASALCAIANLLDRGLVHGEEEDSSPFALLAIGGFLNLIMAVPLGLWVIPQYGLNLEVFAPIFLNGLLYCIAIWLYLICLKIEDTSRVVPFFQIIPLFGIVIANVRLNELPVSSALIGIVFLVIGGLALSIKGGIVKGRLALMMVIASGLVAVNDVVFAEYGRGHAFSEAIFADWCGKGFFGMATLLGIQARRGFIKGLRSKMGLMITSEVSYAMGDGLLDVAKLVMPVAIAQAAFSTQPLFVFLGVALLSRRFPSLKEDLGRMELKNKIIGIIFMVVGGVLLSMQ
jgi:drug/metabolite transporter (DMT)-like permease